jgi:hypothetical protein
MIRIHWKNKFLKIPMFSLSFINLRAWNIVNTSYDWLLLTMFILIDCVIDIGYTLEDLKANP